MKELLDLAGYISRHPRFRSLSAVLNGDWRIRLSSLWPNLDFCGCSVFEATVRNGQCWSRSPVPARILAAAVHALRLRARQFARRDAAHS
jgi:hypothetical protein